MPSNKKLFFGAICSMFLLWYIIGNGDVLSALAAHAQGVTSSSGDFNLAGFLKKIAIFFDFAMFLIYMLLDICSALIDPEFIFTIEGLKTANGTGMLLSIWQFSRNITNVIFVFILVFVALYAVVVPTLGGEFMKTHVVKFILAIILVNFSWFFPRVILDVANVLTATIFNLPASVGSQCKTEDINGKKIDECLYIEETWLFPKSKRANDDDQEKAKECLDRTLTDKTHYIKVSDLVCVKLAPYNKEFNTGMSILQGMYVNHVRIIHSGKVVKEPGPADGTWSSLQELGRFTVQFMFILFYTVAALFPLIAMAIVLLIRIPMIWLTVAFMPFMFVGFVMSDKMGEFNTMSIFKHFVKAAFLPAAMAIPLAVGFIMLNTSIGSACPEGKYAYLCKNQGVIIGSINNLWAMLWSLVAIIVMWVGVFMAIQKIGGIYERVGGAVKSVGENWGKFALQAPLAFPIIPVDGNPRNNQSILQKMRFAQNPNIAISSGKWGKQSIDPSGHSSPEADNMALKHTALLQRIADNIKKGDHEGYKAEMHNLSSILKTSGAKMSDVLLSSTHSPVTNAIRENKTINMGDIRILADEIDQPRIDKNKRETK